MAKKVAKKIVKTVQAPTDEKIEEGGKSDPGGEIMKMKWYIVYLGYQTVEDFSFDNEAEFHAKVEELFRRGETEFGRIFCFYGRRIVSTHVQRVVGFRYEDQKNVLHTSVLANATPNPNGVIPKYAVDDVPGGFDMPPEAVEGEEVTDIEADPPEQDED